MEVEYKTIHKNNNEKVFFGHFTFFISLGSSQKLLKKLTEIFTPLAYWSDIAPFGLPVNGVFLNSLKKFQFPERLQKLFKVYTE